MPTSPDELGDLGAAGSDVGGLAEGQNIEDRAGAAAEDTGIGASGDLSLDTRGNEAGDLGRAHSDYGGEYAEREEQALTEDQQRTLDVQRSLSHDETAGPSE